MNDLPNVLSLRLILYMTEKQEDGLEQSLYDNAPSSSAGNRPVSGSVELSLDSIVLSILDSKTNGFKTTDKKHVSLIISLCPEVSSSTASVSDTSRFTDARFQLSQ